MRRPGSFTCAALVLGMALLTGCGHKRPRAAAPPAAPPISSAPRTAPPENTPARQAPPISVSPDAKPLFVETGLASWYGPPYHNRKGANGEIYDMHAATAAHRTIPLNSIARVTNLATGRSTLVRITDRGPFIEGRIIDLSLAAAKEVDVWRPGVARVRVEVLETPASLESGGRWCVQIGAFTDPDQAAKLKDKLARRYRTAKVLQFTGPTGEWVRVRVAEDDKRRAEEVARDTSTPEGAVFVVRLD